MNFLKRLAPFPHVRRLAGVLIAGVAMSTSGAWAQSTGNPKGTPAPPSQGMADRSPAGSRPAGAGDASSGPLTSESGPASARMNRTVPPGGGTAGGLQQRDITAPEPASGSSTGKGSAAPRPVAPSTPAGGGSSR